MIVLWLLVAHLVGDYLFQTRWQANGKFGWTDEAFYLRTRHALTYTLCFVPICLAYQPSEWRRALFCILLFVAHFLTDAQRFTRTPGECIDWVVARRTGSLSELTPNPWPTIGLAIDQSLHMIQIAVLAQIFLVHA